MIKTVLEPKITGEEYLKVPVLLKIITLKPNSNFVPMITVSNVTKIKISVKFVNPITLSSLLNTKKEIKLSKIPNVKNVT